MIFLKRAYEKPGPKDGTRILVERLWPRGVSRENAKIDIWLKDIAPSTALRKWFGHDPIRWQEFVKRYWAELESNPASVKILREKIKSGPVTFVYAAKDVEHNGALALKMFLEKH